MLTPRDEATILEIVSAANSLFFQKFSKLLRVPFPATIEEKCALLRKIKGHYDAVGSKAELIKQMDKDISLTLSKKGE